MSAQVFSTTAPVPPMMATVGLSWEGVLDFAKKSIKLIQDQGSTFLDLIENGFKAFKAVTGRDFIGVFAAIQQAGGDLQKIIEAIKAEFNI